MVVIKVSVRNLVEFIMRSGDLSVSSSGFRDPDAMQEGSRIHRKLQKRMGAGYRAEVNLSGDFPVTYGGISFEITLEGRADGIFSDETGEVIDEIKGVYRDIHSMKEPVGVHRAQALCYAYLYASSQGLDGIGIRMTYCHIPSEEVRYFHEFFAIGELKDWFLALLGEYAKWAAWQIKWRESRNKGIKALEFPFSYREGQGNLVKGVYQSILRKKRLYIEAPTGVGKTISTVFPAVKSVGEGLTEKIFYLTAKTITRTVAEDTFFLLEANGAPLKTVTLTARGKICILDKPACNPATCERAKGHFDRINDAVYDILSHETTITRDTILEYAEKHAVCPFEFSLDISSFSDVVIGDYNYAFDPTACLKRFFSVEKENDFVFLIDEAHNLVDRAREMYSATIVKETFLEMKRMVKEKNRKAANALDACNRALLELKRQCDTTEQFSDVEIEGVVVRLMRLCTVLEEYFEEDEPVGRNGKAPLLPEERERLLNFYFEARQFQNIYELADDHYIIYGDYNADGAFCLHLQCMDPSVNLDSYLRKGRCGVFFSATLLPIRYYMEQLAGREDDYAVYAPSPFMPQKRLIAIGRDVSTKYTMRGPEMYRKIAEYIIAFAKGRVGNYMVFFPSYQMLAQIREYLLQSGAVIDGDAAEEEELSEIWDGKQEAADGGEVREQSRGDCPAGRRMTIFSQKNVMTEQEREKFLSRFQDKSNRTVVGLCVMGGIFGEGIDLKGDRLIGAVVVGTGLPMVCTENELFKEYFDKKKGTGFSYAYQYPGMNKVLQAAGRVIRTTEDTGAVLLLDERFLQTGYQKLFPREWFPYEVVTANTLQEVLRRFWGKFAQ